ncbi:MAG: hypothetical protein IJ801_03660 [Lachnospiraceae bacterium]|nr:hypothetical protein [Lachnospiraceae bacterium]
MNKQRKVVITTTYNEMGIIIDTKVEEVAQPNLQPTCNQLATDTISRQAAIDALDKRFDSIPMEQTTEILKLRRDLRQLPSAHKEIICCKDCRYYDHEGMLCLDIYGYGRR